MTELPCDSVRQLCGLDAALVSNSTFLRDQIRRRLMKCRDARCRDFQKEVPPGHKHWYRCGDARCKFFQKFVEPGHQHWFRCADARCKFFQKFVEPRHRHWYRCSNARCKSFQKFVPPGHTHEFKTARQPMRKLETEIAGLRELLARMRIDPECKERCKKRYERDLERCGTDRDCIHRATGKYVLCVLSCKKQSSSRRSC